MTLPEAYYQIEALKAKQQAIQARLLLLTYENDRSAWARADELALASENLAKEITAICKMAHQSVNRKE